MIDPTERSTQPRINITVIPQASKRLNVTVTSVLLKFEMVKKVVVFNKDIIRTHTRIVTVKVAILLEKRRFLEDDVRMSCTCSFLNMDSCGVVDKVYYTS